MALRGSAGIWCWRVPNGPAAPAAGYVLNFGIQALYDMLHGGGPGENPACGAWLAHQRDARANRFGLIPIIEQALAVAVEILHQQIGFEIQQLGPDRQGKIELQ